MKDLRRTRAWISGPGLSGGDLGEFISDKAQSSQRFQRFRTDFVVLRSVSVLYIHGVRTCVPLWGPRKRGFLAILPKHVLSSRVCAHCRTCHTYLAGLS